LPASYIIDDELYQKIFLIANAALYPRYTLLKQNSAYFIALDTDDIHIQRGLFFPWKEGISERLVISDLEYFSKMQEKDIENAIDWLVYELDIEGFDANDELTPKGKILEPLIDILENIL